MFLIAGVMLSSFAAYKRFSGIPYQADILAAATKLAGALFVVTAFVERSTAVLTSIWYGDAIRIAKTREVLERIAWMSSVPFAQEIPINLIKTSESVARIEAEQDKARSVAAFILALFVSAVGVRTLEVLQVLPDTPPSTGSWVLQYGLFHAVDIVITAGLIAGGTAGIHAIVDLLAQIVLTTKTKLMMTRPPVS